MNYQKIYESIIQKAKSENRVKHKEVYYENHHIMPKCLGGNNDISNLILLTAKEHFICHKLLTYIYPTNRKIICALHMMTYSCNENSIKSSRDYKFVKELLSDNSKGKKHPMFGKHHSEDAINKMKKPHKKYSKDYMLSLKEIRKGEKNPMYGKKQTKESNEKNSQSHIGKKHTTESKKKMSITRISKHFKHTEQTKKKQGEWQKGKTYIELYGEEKASQMKEKQRLAKLQKNRK